MRTLVAALVTSLALAGTPVLSPTLVSYTLRVDSTDVSGFAVEMHIPNAPATFRLAMATHPEYDDRFWRHVEGLRAEVGGRAATITRSDSSLWTVSGAAGEAVVRYRIRLPAARSGPRAAWTAWLAPTGGLVGGPHSFMYVVGRELAPARVTLELPSGWTATTSLQQAGSPLSFSAPGAAELVEAPILIGRVRTWSFTAGGVPHRVVYWPLPNAARFDTAALVGDAEKITREAIRVFGRAPWHDYTFLYEDAAQGALEHANSVTIGAPSEDLARDPHAYAGETAHEFFHAWNLMRIRPLGYGALGYGTPVMSRGLWFSEGLSMFYADLLRIRAGIPVQDSTRALHLQGLIGRYLSNPGSFRLSAERVSEAAYATEQGTLGDMDASTHLQGELIGAMLDFVIRDATGGKRSVDDLMRTMMTRFSGERGFTSAGVADAVKENCGCDVAPFFAAHVTGGGSPIDFDRYLRLAGMRAEIAWGPALERDGSKSPDRRIRVWVSPRDGAMRLIVTQPEGAWARAGLHTGDKVVRVNGAAVAGFNEFRTLLGALKSGDTVRMEVERASRSFAATVVIAPFDRPFVRVVDDPAASEKARAIRARWVAGLP